MELNLLSVGSLTTRLLQAGCLNAGSPQALPSPGTLWPFSYPTATVTMFELMS